MQELRRAKFPGLIGRIIGLTCAYLDHALLKLSEGSRLKMGERGSPQCSIGPLEIPTGQLVPALV